MPTNLSLDQLASNFNEIIGFPQAFYDPVAADVSYDRFREDGSLETVTHPNLAKILASLGALADFDEAVAGIENTKTMTPLRVAEAIAAKKTFAASLRFDGTGSITLHDSKNISSILDEGNGKYTVNFATDMPDTNYSVIGTASTTLAVNGARLFTNGHGFAGFPPLNTVSSFRICLTYGDAGSSTHDAEIISAIVFYS